MEIHQIPALRSPVMVIAFTGWNDAAEAATGAASHLLGCWTDPIFDVVPELIADVDPEDFYDFQVNRPTIFVDESSVRNLTWPGTQVFGSRTPSLPHDFIVVNGVEPSMKWKRFTSDLLDLADDLEAEMIITMGSMLADTPHTRPITVSGSGAHPDIAKRLGVEISKYEGPTGILGILQSEFEVQGIPSVALWAAIPHYVATPPCPKATLALIRGLEDLLDTSIPVDILIEEARAWQVGVDEMSTDDDEISEYVRGLEESQDTAELPEATGEAIAREFERYLRRRET